jgi:hypothetical protein
MLVLSESSIGFALFSVTDEGKIGKDDLYKSFETAEGANNLSVLVFVLPSALLEPRQARLRVVQGHPSLLESNWELRGA